MEPQRIQRKRTKGWKMPENTIYVGRYKDGNFNIGEFGNPFRVGHFYKIGTGGSGWAYVHCIDEQYADKSFIKVRSNAHAVKLYREYLKRYPLRPEKLEKLKGKNLACWCTPGAPCHADVLLQLANPTLND